MNARKPSQKQMLSSCAEIREDDGIDPREFFKHKRTHKKVDRKTLQLCAQVADILNGLLPDCHDELLQMLQVASVVPAPDASQLLITVYPVIQLEKNFDSHRILGQLTHAAGHLRTEIAAAITRKRAPTLLFQVAASLPRKEGER